MEVRVEKKLVTSFFFFCNHNYTCDRCGLVLTRKDNLKRYKQQKGCQNTTYKKPRVNKTPSTSMKIAPITTDACDVALSPVTDDSSR